MVKDQHPVFVLNLLTFMCNKVNLPKSFESTVNYVSLSMWWMSVENADAVDLRIMQESSAAIERILYNVSM